MNIGYDNIILYIIYTASCSTLTKRSRTLPLHSRANRPDCQLTCLLSYNYDPLMTRPPSIVHICQLISCEASTNAKWLLINKRYGCFEAEWYCAGFDIARTWLRSALRSQSGEIQSFDMFTAWFDFQSSTCS